MKHKKKILFAAVSIVLLVAAHTSYPGLVKHIIVHQARQKGWVVSAPDVSVGWLHVNMRNVQISSVDGQKSGKFESVHIPLDSSLKPKCVYVKNGHMSVKHAGSKPKENSQGTCIVASGVDISYEHESATISSIGTSVSANGPSLTVSAKNVNVMASHGERAELENVKAEKPDKDAKISVEKMTVSYDGKSASFRNSVVEKISFSGDSLSFFASTENALFPENLSSKNLTAKISAEMKKGIRVKFDIKADSILGQHDYVSKKSVAASDVSMEGEAEGESKNSWKIRSGVKVGQAKIGVSAEKQDSAWSLSVMLYETDCQSVMEAIPETMRPDLEGLEFNGSMGFHVSIVSALNSHVPLVEFSMRHRCKVKSVPQRISDAMNGKPFKRHVYSGTGVLKEVTGSAGTKVSVSPYMLKALMTTEDPGFLEHHGFDIEAIKNSIRDNVKDRKFTRGASTIPMQLAKNMFLSRDKTATRKLQEFFLTIVIDQKMNKDQILSAYLSLIEFGPDVYGIQAASNHYFGISPSQLSLGQSVFLASILPKPRAHYFGQDGNLTQGKKSQMGLILDLMLRKGAITDEECERAKTEEIVLGKGDSEKYEVPVDWVSE